MSQKTHNEHSSSSKNYIIGFILSIIFTIIAFYSVNSGMTKGWILFTIFFAAVVQLFIQLWFFLHLDQESKPFYMTQAFAFAVLTLFIFVGGSIWVMYQLNYNMM